MKNTSKLAKKFDKQANVYNRQRKNKSLGRWRAKLIKDAEGKVLELAVGAGANFPYYSSDVEVTAVDISPKMINFAKYAAKDEQIQAKFMLSNLETLDFPENSFDTIVSTLSFCGYEDPDRMLQQLNHWCKPDGRILLMEHGISTNSFLAMTQKLLNPLNHKIVGCHLKRDMLALAKASDLQIQHHEQYWKGIFHLIWARPSQKN